MIISIFNDVIGPVMRGPSSSHCAAALRIGRLARDLMNGDIDEVHVQFDRGGALATTHDTQGSDMGLFGGLLGWDAADARLPDSAQSIRDAKIVVNIELIDCGDPHPSTYRLRLRNAHQSHTLRAISTGGGMVKVIDIDGFAVSIDGDYFETLVHCQGDAQTFAQEVLQTSHAVQVHVLPSADGDLVQIKSQERIDDATFSRWHGKASVQSVQRLAPVLPVKSRKDCVVPFTCGDEMLRYYDGQLPPLWKAAVDYECARGGLSERDVLSRMEELVQILRTSIQQGIEGTQYQDRILGHQCGQFKSQMEAGRLLPGGGLNRIVLYVSALMEVKSSMGVIIAAPTAGACAALPGACVAMADEMDLSDQVIAKGLLAAGLIGAFIATRSTFAAEVAGCQAECGAAACMAAAGLVTMADGLPKHAVAAASMALQSSLGLICDPVGNRVEVPCLGKNVLAATNALSCANMAMSDYDPVITLDEVIETADRVGRSLPRELRCTALGGLAATKTSREIEKKLATLKAGSCGSSCGCG
ncbi:L-serine dehydratase, alpha chain [Planctomycetes bacterium CA13]|uniref:L-serine ammonia-lyase n=1 Tax=Novipirellula herctigrandis TaxID=2527986 RepID=A0A5C5ZES2_9BACT|nr:L-serine dehydratase, alpha chain [Planctomycetes bacterium CA13]